MPSSVLKDSAEQVEMMLAHELAHVCRRDLLWNWLFIIGEILFFFHPLAWLTRKERTLCCELACDQLALKLTGRAPQAYGSMLIDVVAQAQMKAPALRLVSVSMFETTNTLKRRLKAMNIKTNYLASVAGVVLVALAASLLVPMKLVAETPDEAVLRLKAENAKLKQQLEALQQQREAARKESDALAGDQELAWKRFAEAAASKEQGQQRNEMEALARSMREMQRAWAESLKTQELLRKVQEREKTETAANTARKAEQRELLLQELKLAEQQAVDTRKRLENGKGSFDQVLAVQRELLELKLQLAELHGNRTEQRQVLEEQLKVAERHLAEEKKRVEVGTQPPGSEIPAQREVLRLKRALMALE
jgi:hypothetical protein